MAKLDYTWRVGDVFANGEHRWSVVWIDGDRAVLRSCGSSWATTRPLTFDEWREGGRWTLVAETQRTEPDAEAQHG